MASSAAQGQRREGSPDGSGRRGAALCWHRVCCLCLNARRMCELPIQRDGWRGRLRLGWRRSVASLGQQLVAVAVRSGRDVGGGDVHCGRRCCRQLMCGLRSGSWLQRKLSLARQLLWHIFCARGLWLLLRLCLCGGGGDSRCGRLDGRGCGCLLPPRGGRRRRAGDGPHGRTLCRRLKHAHLGTEAPAGGWASG